MQGSGLRHCQCQGFLFFRKEVVTLKKERLCTILFLTTLAALGEYWHAVSGGTEAQAASFSMRERRWSLPSIPPLEGRRVGLSSLPASRSGDAGCTQGKRGVAVGRTACPGSRAVQSPEAQGQSPCLGLQPLSVPLPRVLSQPLATLRWEETT